MKHLISLKPDAYIATENTNKEITRYFLELFDDVPAKYLRDRVRRYITYFESDEWQDNTDKPFPYVVFVCPNERLRRHLMHYLKNKLGEDSNLLIYLTTPEVVKIKGLSEFTS